MKYRTLKECVLDLERHGQLIRVKEEVNPDLEMAEIQRRVFESGGPALYYENISGSPFPAVSNLFGTIDRARFVFRSTQRAVERLIELKSDPMPALRNPFKYSSVPFAAIKALPRKVRSSSLRFKETTISQLPQIRSWPEDGGAFITLPQVFSADPDSEGIMNSNLGMYRIQISGNQYRRDEQVGLHYQIHRGIGVHHSRAIKKGEALKVSIFIGGPPAHTFAAVMPLPEGLSELMFGGAFAGRRFRYARKDGYTLSADADFVIIGTIDSDTLLPEGPFGDHLGYYSLRHDFPVLNVEKVWHRSDAVWPFTVVGRPPQEDTIFGQLIHEITGPLIPQEIPGLKAVNAVDAAGVHPLLLAIGSERYVPYGERRPMEILTTANAILGYGQMSLAKYLFICAGEDNPQLDIHDMPAYFRHILERVDWTRDLHFLTRTTIDTLDYSGSGLNSGSKVVVAAAGPKRRKLATKINATVSLPAGFKDVRLVLPGILSIEGPAFADYDSALNGIEELSAAVKKNISGDDFPLIIISDDSRFTARNLNSFLWVTFTRSDPARDIYGVDPFVENKHWGCGGSLIIDARRKPHHAPPLQEDPQISKRVDQLAAKGGSLHGIF